MNKPPSQPIPAWVWIFVVACAAIPIVSLGGALPAAIGVGGAFGCIAIGRNASRSAGMRIGICIGITVLCWVLFVVLVVGLTLLTNR